MNPVNAHKLLESMQQMIQSAQNQTAQNPQQGNFKTALVDAIEQTNSLQMQSSEKAALYEKGDPSVELQDVMISMQKSSVSFQALTQVRNRLVEAYHDIMNMPV